MRRKRAAALVSVQLRRLAALLSGGGGGGGGAAAAHRCSRPRTAHPSGLEGARRAPILLSFSRRRARTALPLPVNSPAEAARRSEQSFENASASAPAPAPASASVTAGCCRLLACSRSEVDTWPQSENRAACCTLLFATVKQRTRRWRSAVGV